ncbi:MAG: tRNA (cytidine(34)-2'-O)-methyltransferase [Verrucomicrobiota bacterium]
MFNVVLVEPEIPPNTGNAGRLCLATDSTLHLVEPLGFSLDDRKLRRAGLDYWEKVKLRRWANLSALEEANPLARFFYLTTKSRRPYYEVDFAPGDFLVFGRETKGLPATLLDRKGNLCLTIPTLGVRSLNLATAVAVVLFEAMRQIQGANAPETGNRGFMDGDSKC